MAKRFVGTMPLSGMIAFCAILLFAPVARSQNITITKKTYTISGNIGLAGVSLQGLPGTPLPTTDENGVFSVTVEHGWTGKVTPVKLGFTFQPPSREYTRVTANMPDQDFLPTMQTYTITGSVGQADVRMGGFPTEVVSDQSGRYTAKVEYGWSGTVAPDKTGFRFDPPSRSYNQVTKNFPDDNYKPTEVTFTISGLVGAPDVVMQGLPGNPKSDANGRYSAEIRYGTTNLKVTPTREGHEFTPDSYDYPIVLSSYENQDFSVHVITYVVSGSTGLPGVMLKGFGPDPILSDENGFYQTTVVHGWKGTVVPEKPGYTFEPASRPYAKVTADVENENYTGSVVYLKIEGTIPGLGAVELAGFPGGVVTTDDKGVYSVRVEYGFTGTIVPVKEGYSFTPAERPYNAIAADQLKQDFRGEKIFYEISGIVGQPGVFLKGFPTSVVSRSDGSYSAKVPYNWEGTVTPTKQGFMFQPAEQRYTSVLASEMNQDYSPRIIQYAISGKVVDKSGAPIPDVLITAGGQVQSAMTDADGLFELMVDHGWKGRITVERNGYTFTPSTKAFDVAMMSPISNQTITGEVKMMTITNTIKAGTEAIQGVKVTANPGGYTAMTDVNGKYAIKVPYGWTGSLEFFKDDLDIEGTVDYVNVVTDMEGLTPKGGAPTTPPTGRTPPPVTTTPPPVTTTPPPVTTTPPPVTTTPPPGRTPPPVTTPQPDAALPDLGMIETPRTALLQKAAQLKQELDTLLDQEMTAATQARIRDVLSRYNSLRAMAEGRMPIDATRIDLLGGGDPGFGGLIEGSGRPKLLSTLVEISRQSATKIAVDLTVRDEEITKGIGSLQGMPVNLALTEVLKGTKKEYTFKAQPDGTYLVYHPISNTFAGSDILTALDALSSEAEVPIIPDPNVSGNTSANFANLPLEDALTMILAATPYVYKNMGTFYIVGDRSPTGPAFFELSETRYLRLNHQVPVKVKEMLALQYQQYVQAETPNANDPNDQGHILVVTAPKAIAGTIMETVRRLDMPRRQVLLDARVVAMERGNLLNLGVQWQMPSMSAGAFYDGDAWTKGLQVGYSADSVFTNSLMATLNLLESMSQADIVTNPQLIAQDGKQAQLRSIREEWFMMSDNQMAGQIYSRSELQKIEAGTILTITPRIGDSNDITLEMAVEVSSSVAKGRESDLPIVTRRQARNSVTVQNGGTVAVAGLTENRTAQVEQKVPVLGSLPLIGRAFRNNSNDKETREIAVFVTATLIPDIRSVTTNRTPVGIAAGPGGAGAQPQPAGEEFTTGLREALNRQP
jgi:Flp pilus assembly secretin CpaC